jgi:hypothetical protein
VIRNVVPASAVNAPLVRDLADTRILAAPRVTG